MKLKVVGIASLPEREECLRDTVNSLYNQVDKIIVGLNNYKEVPSFLKKEKIESYLLDNSLGDAAKFYKVDEYKGHFYFACDDDLIYKKNYIEHLLKNNNPVIGIHASIIKYPCKNYYKDRIVLHSNSALDKDTEVDVIGTGCCRIDLEVLDLKLKDFKTPNKADIYLSDICKKQNVKMISIARKAKEFFIYNPKMKNKYTIYDDLHSKETPIHCEIIKKWEK